MKFNLLIRGGIYQSQSAFHAQQFCRATIAKGHVISYVFFYQEGVSQANRFLLPLADEHQVIEEWVAIKNEHSLDLVVCVAAAERRGIIDDATAKESGDFNGNLHPGWRVAGLGSFIQACIDADRTVTF